MIRIDYRADRLEIPDSSALMKRIEAVLVDAIEENWRRGGRPRWQQLTTGENSLLQDSGRLRSTVKGKSGKDFAEATWGGTGYARVHQFGQRQQVTLNQRKFFWWMWYKTKDPKWKGMAVSKKAFFTTPARPHDLTEVDVQKIREAVKSNLFRIVRSYDTADYGTINYSTI